MTTHSPHSQTHLISGIPRRQFLQYMVGSATATIVLGCLRPAESVEPSLEHLCSASPLNSRCKDYLPGVKAKNENEQPIEVDQLLATAQPGDRIAVKGLDDPRIAYLVITDPPNVAEYAINPTCTHLGCTVEWEADQQQFVCPCHGSRYDNHGRVIHGPAKRHLDLTTVVVKKNQIRLVTRPPVIDPRVKVP